MEEESKCEQSKDICKMKPSMYRASKHVSGMYRACIEHQGTRYKHVSSIKACIEHVSGMYRACIEHQGTRYMHVSSIKACIEHVSSMYRASKQPCMPEPLEKQPKYGHILAAFLMTELHYMIHLKRKASKMTIEIDVQCIRAVVPGDI